MVSLTSSHKTPLGSCAQLLLSGRSAYAEVHAAHSHWPQAHVNTALPPQFLCHYSMGWLWFLFTCKQEEGRGCYNIWKIRNWFLLSHLIVPAPVSLPQACHLSAGMAVWQKQSLFFAVGPWALLGPISHWTVCNAFSCWKLWGGSISSCFLRELSCIKML